MVTDLHPWHHHPFHHYSAHVSSSIKSKSASGLCCFCASALMIYYNLLVNLRCAEDGSGGKSGLIVDNVVNLRCVEGGGDDNDLIMVVIMVTIV